MGSPRAEATRGVCNHDWILEVCSSEANKKMLMSLPLPPHLCVQLMQLDRDVVVRGALPGTDRWLAKPSEMRSSILIDMNLIDAPAWKFLLPLSPLLKVRCWY